MSGAGGSGGRAGGSGAGSSGGGQGAGAVFRGAAVGEFLGGVAGLGAEAELHAVVPLAGCAHLASVTAVPAAGLRTDAACGTCGNVGENWTCLTCWAVGCGRYVAGHAVGHGAEAGHPMALSFADLSVWCYVCDAYVHHQDLLPAKSAAHQHKFGMPIPG